MSSEDRIVAAQLAAGIMTARGDVGLRGNPNDWAQHAVEVYLACLHEVAKRKDEEPSG